MKQSFFAAFVGVLLAAQALPLSASAACANISSTLYRGQSGSEVRSLQTFLVTRNYPGGGAWMITGTYGPATETAVRNFQRESGLPVTGAVDSATRDTIVRASCGGSGYISSSYSYLSTPTNYTYDWSGGYAYPYQPTYPTYPSYPTYPTYPTYPSHPYYPYPQYAQPFLNMLSPHEGFPGTVVTIYGTGFEHGNNTIYFDGTALSAMSYGGATLSFTVPQNARAGINQVKVSNSRGTSNALDFNVIGYGCGGYYPYYYGSYCPQPTNPTIQYLSPASGTTGTYVTIYGLGFALTNNTVHFGSMQVSGTVSSDGRMVSFQVPSVSTGTYSVSVNSNGHVTNSVPFTVTSSGSSTGQPTITNISGPTSLPAGQTGTWSLSVNNPGGGYLSVSVDWGDTGAYATAPQTMYASQQTLSFTHTYYQSGTYTVRFTVTNGSGSNTTTTTVNVGSGNTGTVWLSSIAPSSGRVGDTVVLTGSSFTNDNTVHFGIGGKRYVPSFNNGTAIYFTIPAYVSPCDTLAPGAICAAYVQLITPGTYQVYVANGNGTSQQVTFTVTP